MRKCKNVIKREVMLRKDKRKITQIGKTITLNSVSFSPISRSIQAIAQQITYVIYEKRYSNL